MKKLLLLSLLSAFSFSASAVSLKCKYTGDYNIFNGEISAPQDGNWMVSYNVGVSKLAFSCETSKGYWFKVKNLQVGPELIYSENGFADFTIYCPLISSEKLAKKIQKRQKPIRLGGLHASAGVGILSGKAGLAAGFKTGPCTLSSAGWGVGGGVAIDSFTIDYAGKEYPSVFDF